MFKVTYIFLTGLCRGAVGRAGRRAQSAFYENLVIRTPSASTKSHAPKRASAPGLSAILDAQDVVDGPTGESRQGILKNTHIQSV